METNQINLFDEVEEVEEVEVEEKSEDHLELDESEVPFDVGDSVRIVVPPHKESDIEAYFYLNDFKDKRGTVTKVVPEPLLQYEVDVAGRNALVYHDELLHGWAK